MEVEKKTTSGRKKHHIGHLKRLDNIGNFHHDEAFEIILRQIDSGTERRLNQTLWKSTIKRDHAQKFP